MQLLTKHHRQISRRRLVVCSCIHRIVFSPCFLTFSTIDVGAAAPGRLNSHLQFPLDGSFLCLGWELSPIIRQQNYLTVSILIAIPSQKTLAGASIFIWGSNPDDELFLCTGAEEEWALSCLLTTENSVRQHRNATQGSCEARGVDRRYANAVDWHRAA